MIFVDSSVPMYVVGSEPRLKLDASRTLEQAIARGEKLVTNGEVLQEILHRYVAVRRPDAIQPAFDALLGVVDEVFAVTREDVEEAKQIVLGAGGRRSARDAIHLATMARHRITRIMSFDTGFDGFPGVERLR